MTAVRDRHRGAVYGAENTLSWLYDHPAATVELSGVTLTPEPEARFGSIASVQSYVDRVLAHPGVAARFGAPGPITVRSRRGDGKAHYEPGRAVIAVHPDGDRWAMRELVVLHEVTHHLADPVGHGPGFTAGMIDLIGIVMGPQASLALRILYDQEGVS